MSSNKILKENVNRVHNFRINKHNLLFFDIFYKNNKLYLILPIYNKLNVNRNMHIFIDNKKINIYKKIIKNKYEPILIYIYEYNCNKENIDVAIIYNNIIKYYKLDNISSNEKKNLTITTLFKDDYKLFLIFYDYYINQGVDHFYMYYNGVIKQEIKDIYNRANVTLIEWNFRYWNETNGNPNLYAHHAQLGQIHHCIYKYGKGISQYMIFCDLDEYMHIPGKTLLEYIKQTPNIDVFGFCNNWSITFNNKIPNKFPNKFGVSKTNKYMFHSKNIYKISSISTINIHYSDSFTKNHKLIKDFNMYHFYNWSGKKRTQTLKFVKKELQL